MNARIIYLTDSLISLLGCLTSFSNLDGHKTNFRFPHPTRALSTVLPQILEIIIDSSLLLTFHTQTINKSCWLCLQNISRI